MDIQAIKDRICTSPAFIVDEIEVIAALQALVALRARSGCKILYSIKSLPLTFVLSLTKLYVDGFSVSSLFEARLAYEVMAGQGSIHLTTPGIRPDEIEECALLCSHISCNSINQYQLVSRASQNRSSIGIRINPKLSFTDDVRYDPCRPYSKLGADMRDVLNSEITGEIRGLHFHTVFSQTDFTPLIQTLDKIREIMGERFVCLDWLNLGGGYLFDQIKDNSGFIELIGQLKSEYGLEVYIEPGNAIVGKAGYLLTTVIDCFTSDGKVIAILDTSVNHHPQVFEYQRQPELYEHDAEGDYPVILAGSTCLAGDIFGEYRFNQPLQVGDKVIFRNVGSYSLVKANRFNGYNLPDVYIANDNQLRLIKQDTYQDYRQQWATNL